MEFCTNPLASLVYVVISVVANYMRSLGVQAEDDNGQGNIAIVKFRTNPLILLVYFSTNTYQLASLVEF